MCVMISINLVFILYNEKMKEGAHWDPLFLSITWIFSIFIGAKIMLIIIFNYLLFY